MQSVGTKPNLSLLDVEYKVLRGSHTCSHEFAFGGLSTTIAESHMDVAQWTHQETLRNQHSELAQGSADPNSNCNKQSLHPTTIRVDLPRRAHPILNHASRGRAPKRTVSDVVMPSQHVGRNLVTCEKKSIRVAKPLLGSDEGIAVVREGLEPVSRHIERCDRLKKTKNK